MTKEDYDNEKLAKLRTGMSLTQEDVAGRIGVSRFTVIRAEQGNAASWKLLQSFAEFYKVSISDLIRPSQNAA